MDNAHSIGSFLLQDYEAITDDESAADFESDIDEWDHITCVRAGPKLTETNTASLEIINLQRYR